jgi:hypothetical protein
VNWIDLRVTGLRVTGGCMRPRLVLQQHDSDGDALSLGLKTKVLYNFDGGSV